MQNLQSTNEGLFERRDDDCSLRMTCTGVTLLDTRWIRAY